jgi:hypothetical protein
VQNVQGSNQCDADIRNESDKKAIPASQFRQSALVPLLINALYLPVLQALVVQLPVPDPHQ